MDNIAHKYNRFLITLMVFAPLLAYITLSFLDIDFKTFLQLLSYVGVVLVIAFRDKSEPVKFPKYLIYYLLFILYVFYSAFVQLDREFKIIYLFKNGLIGGFNLMLIIENIHITKKHHKFMIKWSFVLLLIAVAVIMLQQSVDKNLLVKSGTAYSSNFVVSSKGAGGTEDRLYSIYSWVGSLANGFGFVPVFILIVEILYRKKKNVLLLIIAGILYVFLTKGRWIMLNAFLVFIILLMNRKDKVKQFFKYLFLVPIIMFGSYLTLNLIGIDVEDIVVNRVLELNDNSEQRSATTRFLAFEVFNKLYWKNPILGVGNQKYGMGLDETATHNYELRLALAGRSAQIHVGYLALFYRFGFVGGIFFIAFLIFLLKKLYQSAKKTTYWAPFLGVLGFAIANLTLVTFSIYEMGIIIALAADRYYNQNMGKIGYD